jgi:alpha-galactosidase
MYISYEINGIYIDFFVDENGFLKLLNFSNNKVEESRFYSLDKKVYVPIQLQLTGFNQNSHHGNKYSGTSPADKLKYIEHKYYRNSSGDKLEFLIGYEDIYVRLNYQFYDEIKAVRAYSTVEVKENEYTLEYISSFHLLGISKFGTDSYDENIKLHIPHNTWHGEFQWRINSLKELGMSKVNSFSLKRITYGASGTWSTCGYISMGCIENTSKKEFTMWQVEHNGSWCFELSDMQDDVYFQVSGPTFNEGHFAKKLKPGIAFQTVPVAVSFGDTFEKCAVELTKYRRKIIRNCDDNDKSPVIFNDYMNCLMGDPTSEKLYPLIDAASEVGCKYFCIDAGWFADEMGNEMAWWKEVGLWQPSATRFPEGLVTVLEYISKRDMIPGLWLELEVMGIDCPLAKDWDDDCFFIRNNERIIDNGRFHLDFRNKKVIEHSNNVIDRLVNDYKIGYIKMDYNINGGIGTEIDADSFGDGLLKHNRAYLEWLDNIFTKYPDLVIENCGSGGMRMDYAMLSRHSIQSISDQMKYTQFSRMSAVSAASILPEQSAVWSYPMVGCDREEVVYNMINTMAQRIHQSGHLNVLSIESKNLVKEAIAVYSTYNEKIFKALPFWPNRFPKYCDEWITYGLEFDEYAIVAIWKQNASISEFSVSFEEYGYKNVECIYPSFSSKNEYQLLKGVFNISLEGKYTARLFKFTK